MKMYRKNSLGIGTWRIWNIDNIIYYAHTSVEGGSEVLHREVVELNQSGRNLQEQIELQMNSRISKMKDKGYKESRDEALNGSTNQLGLRNPMLAQPLDKVSIVKKSRLYVQRKYDGHRCLITKQDGEILAYSRKGKLINTISHILAPLYNVLPDGITLDGELYVHGKSLQSISSLIKRVQPANTQLKYHAYDLMSNEDFEDRFLELTSIIPPAEPSIDLVPTYAVSGIDHALDWFRKFREEGYEGAILRQSIKGYEDNKRSNQLIKIKEWFDDEFLVVDAHAGKNDVAILVLKMPDGRTFDCLAPGSVSQKQYILKNKDLYIGKYLTVEYAGFTEDKIPFPATALRFREDI